MNPFTSQYAKLDILYKESQSSKISIRYKLELKNGYQNTTKKKVILAAIPVFLQELMCWEDSQ